MKKLLNAAENRKGGKLFNFRPLLFAAAFFSFGIVFAYAHMFLHVSLWWSAAAIPVFFTAVFLSAEKGKAWKRALCLLFLFALGMNCFARELRDFRELDYYEGEHTVIGTVTEKAEYEKSARLTFSGLYIDGKKTEGKFVAYMGYPDADSLKLADKAVFVGRLETNTDLSGEYGLKSREIGEEIRYAGTISDFSVVGRSPDVFLRFRARMRQRIYAGMDSDSAAVAYALLTGDSSGIETGLLENIRAGGIAHIFAVSGLHIGALYAFCLLIADKTKMYRLPKVARMLFVAAVVLCYGGVCGFSASVVRASVMCLIGYAFRLSGVKYDSLESIGVAAIVILFLRPVSLFDAGFQLSFGACFSISAFRHSFSCALNRIFPEHCIKCKDVADFENDQRADGIAERMRKACVSFLAVTLSAQVGTLPVLLIRFGGISLWSLLLNCVFVPLAGAIFSFLLAAVLIAALLPVFFAPLILYIPSMVLSAALLVFYAFDFSVVLSEIKFGKAALPYYGFFIVVSDKMKLGGKKKYGLIFLLLFIFALSVSLMNA